MIRIFFTNLFSLFLLSAALGQVVPFDDVTIGQDTFWNGIDQTGGFTSGAAYFPNVYNPNFGGYWESGWALSNKTDGITSGAGNLYSAKPATGADSDQYAVGQQNAIIQLQAPLLGQALTGVYITNGTYAHNSMRDGDGFAKKFGGANGDDPDFFLLTIRKYYEGILHTESVNFYLADFRFEDNSQDYIVDTWEFVDLSSLGNVDSLHFELESTDMSGGFFNTPLFFCIDQLNAANPLSTINHSLTALPIKVFPNPAMDFIQIESDSKEGNLSIFNAQGKTVYQKTKATGNQKIQVSHLPQGVYFIHWKKNETIYQGKFIR